VTSPYRAMCAELVEALHEHTCLYEGHESELVARARALLAQSVEEGPSDEEIMELMPQQMRDDLAAAADALACGLAITGFERDSPKAAGVCRLILNRHAVDHARAALAKWGHPTPQPVAEGPTVMEIIELHSWLEDEWRANNDGEDLPMVDFARAVLAKWGRQ
jgi:hypothetical protein